MTCTSRGASPGLVLCGLLAAPAGAQTAAPDAVPDPTPVRAFGAGALSRDLPQPTARAIHEDREGEFVSDGNGWRANGDVWFATGRGPVALRAGTLDAIRLQPPPGAVTVRDALVVGLVAGVVPWRTGRLRRRARHLERAVEREMARVKVLRGLIPICASCKKIRDDGGFWNQVEEFIAANSQADFSQGLCPQCLEVEFSEIAQAERRRATPGGGDPPAGTFA